MATEATVYPLTKGVLKTAVRCSWPDIGRSPELLNVPQALERLSICAYTLGLSTLVKVKGTYVSIKRFRYEWIGTARYR
jgi:hypothetical protein